VILDFVYLVHNLNHNAILRLKKSQLSLIKQKSKNNCKFCIYDSSLEPIYDKLKNYKVVIDKYFHLQQDVALYNRSISVNNAFKNLISTKHFMISDIDLIFPKNFISQIYRFYIKNKKIFSYGKLWYLPPHHSNSFNYDLLRRLYAYKCEICDFGCGVFLTNKRAFENINGFDEEYVGWGYEDTDFNFRMKKYHKLKEENVQSNQVLMHQYHDSRKNKEKSMSIENEKMFKNKKNEMLQSENYKCKKGLIFDK